MADHDIFLNRLRWKTVYGEFDGMTIFSTDCITYKFRRPLTREEQMDFISFLGDSEHMNTLSPVDFCNFFLKNKIPFSLKFKYIKDLSIKDNYRYAKIIKALQQELRKLNCM
jgi:hypothetical protein